MRGEEEEEEHFNDQDIEGILQGPGIESGRGFPGRSETPLSVLAETIETPGGNSPAPSDTSWEAIQCARSLAVPPSPDQTAAAAAALIARHQEVAEAMRRRVAADAAADASSGGARGE